MRRNAIEHRAEFHAGEFGTDADGHVAILLENLHRDGEIEFVVDPSVNDADRGSGEEDPRDDHVGVEYNPHRPRRDCRMASRTSEGFTPTRRACERTLPIIARNSLLAGAEISFRTTVSPSPMTTN